MSFVGCFGLVHVVTADGNGFKRKAGSYMVD
jgi:hypothetical protein